MKKSYVKPQVLFESFQLSASIAAGCAYITNAAYGVCPSVFDKENHYSIFTEGTCTYYPPNAKDQVCEHVPSDATRAFSSL